MEIHIQVETPSGERIKTYHEGQFLCPICGSEMELKRSKAADFMEDINDQPVNVIKRTYYCPTCENKIYSHVWRPYGENNCCQTALGHLHRSQEQIIDTWVEQGDGTLFFKRISAFACTCGIQYVWPEMGIAPSPENLQ